MTLASVAALLDALRRNALLAPPRLAELETRLAGVGVAPATLARELVRRDWLTAYQAEQLLAGKGDDLRVGSYRLLQRLGAGGMGEVFKAADKLDRVVALKRIRKEHLDNEQAVRRFRREVEAAGQLSHPNIVRALNADEVNGQHLLIMEFVEGADLGRLVRAKGPLPIARANDCVRQAALGLQHAHEKGLVHRDIKPSNLIITPRGEVKLLDLGVVMRAEGNDDSAATPLTRLGLVIGTADYMSPEQALNSRAVDIRGDLYSLGCTWYYLLTARLPFPDPEPLAKLVKHRLDDPLPIEHLRPEVPSAVVALVRQLMRKNPDDRPPTPAALVALIERLKAAPAPPLSLPAIDAPDAEPNALTSATRVTARRGRREPRSRWPLVLVGLALVLAAAMLTPLIRRGGEAARPPAAPAKDAHKPSPSPDKPVE